MLGCMYSPMADATEPWWLYYLQKKNILMWILASFGIVLYYVALLHIRKRKELSRYALRNERVKSVFSIKTGQSYSQCAAFLLVNFDSFKEAMRQNWPLREADFEQKHSDHWFRPWAGAPSEETADIVLNSDLSWFLLTGKATERLGRAVRFEVS